LDIFVHVALRSTIIVCFVSVCLSVSVCVSVCLFVSQSMCLSVCLSVSLCLSVSEMSVIRLLQVGPISIKLGMFICAGI